MHVRVAQRQAENGAEQAENPKSGHLSHWSVFLACAHLSGLSRGREGGSLQKLVGRDGGENAWRTEVGVPIKPSVTGFRRRPHKEKEGRVGSLFIVISGYFSKKAQVSRLSRVKDSSQGPERPFGQLQEPVCLKAYHLVEWAAENEGYGALSGSYRVRSRGHVFPQPQVSQNSSFPVSSPALSLSRGSNNRLDEAKRERNNANRYT